jgi:hypothetical protein
MVIALFPNEKKCQSYDLGIEIRKFLEKQGVIVVAELEKADPELAKAYRDSRTYHAENRRLMFEAMTDRISRSGTGILREQFNRAQKGTVEEVAEPLVAQIQALYEKSPGKIAKLRGAMIGALPQLKPKADLKNLPAPTPMAAIKASLDAETWPIFETLLADAKQYSGLPQQRARVYGVLAKARRLAQEKADPTRRTHAKQLSSLSQKNPAGLAALREATLRIVGQPDSLLRIVSKANAVTGKTERVQETIDLDTSPLVQQEISALTAAGHVDMVPLLQMLLKTTQKRMATEASQIQQFYQSAELNGPYAPLARFGDYEVFAEKEGEKLPIYARFERASDQTRAVAALQAEGWTVHTGFDIRSAVQDSPMAAAATPCPRPCIPRSANRRWTPRCAPTRRLAAAACRARIFAMMKRRTVSLSSKPTPSPA